MNILYTLDSGNFGGMEQHVLDLAIGMKKKGHNVYVWCREGPITEILSNDDIEVDTVDIKYECDPRYIYKLIKFLKSKQIQIIHAHELKAVANSMPASFLAGTKVRISHTHTPISEWKISPLRKLINTFVNSTVVNLFSTKEIALTESRKQKKLKEGIFANKLLVTHASNAVNIKSFDESQNHKLDLRKEICDKYGFSSQNIVWGYIARLSVEKGHFVLVNAFNQFLKKTGKTNHILLLVGGGNLEKEINDYIQENQLQKNIFITGSFLSEERTKYYMSLDYFIHPSLAEGFGISLLEAMASKIPVIASDLEVFHEIAGDSIVYFRIGDSDDLVQKMFELEKNKNTSKIDMAYKIVNNYSIEKFVNEYEKIYTKFLNPNLV